VSPFFHLSFTKYPSQSDPKGYATNDQIAE
jgi:hypothetical protein